MNYFIDLINKKSESSSIRFCLIFSFLFVTLTPFIVWGIVCIQNGKLEDLPGGIVTFGLGVLGIITTGKVFEKKEENKNGVS